jgi:WD40 repeat protein
VGGGEGREPGFLQLRDAATGKKILHSLTGHTRSVVGVAFSPDGKRLISAAGTMGDYSLTRHRIGEIKIWDVASGEQLHSWQPHNVEIACLAVSPDGTRAATADWDSVIHVWEVQTRRRVCILEGHAYGVTGVAFSPDGRRLASAGVDTTVRVWDVPNGKQLAVLRGHKRWVNNLAFLTDGKRIVSACDDATVKVWDAVGGRECQTFPGRSDVAHAMLFRPDASRVALFSEDTRLALYDVPARQQIAAFRMPDLTPHCSALSPDDRLLAAGSGFRFGGSSKPTHRAVHVWDVRSGKVVYQADFKEGVSGVSFSSGGKWLAAVSAGRKGGELRIWNVQRWEAALAVPLNDAEDYARVAFSSDEQQLVCLERVISRGELRSKVSLWKLASGGIWRRERQLDDETINHIPRRPFDSDGRLLALTCGDHRVKVFDTHTGRLVHALRGHNFWVIDAAFSPDGKRLATASLDRTVIIWDTKGQQTLTLRGHGDRVVGVMWSADGNSLTSCTTGGEVKIWTAEPLPEGD